MTPIKAIAYTIDRDKHKEQQAKRLKENYGRFRAKVVREKTDDSTVFPIHNVGGLESGNVSTKDGGCQC